MEEPTHKFIPHVEVLAHIFINVCDDSSKSFREMAKFEIKKEDLDKIYEEYFVLYLYYLMRILKGVFPESEHKTVIEGILVRVIPKLEERGVDVSNLMMIFNKRYDKHESYKFFSLEKKNGVVIEESVNNAINAFSLEIAKILKKEFFSGPVEALTSTYIGIIEKKLESQGIVLGAKYQEVKVIKDIREAI